MQQVCIKTWARESLKISKGMLTSHLKYHSREMQKGIINLSQKHLVLEGNPMLEWRNSQQKDLNLCKSE